MTSGKRRRTPTSILSDMEFNEEHIDSANGLRDALNPTLRGSEE